MINNITYVVVGALSFWIITRISQYLRRYASYRRSTGYILMKWLKNGLLKPKSQYSIRKLEDDNYLISRGVELIGSGYLYHLFLSKHEDLDITQDKFEEICSSYLYYYGDDEEGFYVVQSGTELLRPPEPPMEYPPLPEGWEDYDIT